MARTSTANGQIEQYLSENKSANVRIADDLFTAAVLFQGVGIMDHNTIIGEELMFYVNEYFAAP